MTRAAASLNPQDHDALALQAAIARFATGHAGLARERAALPSTPRERLTVLLREIDETVLPRRIVLSKDGAGFASLIVSNRRLFTIADTPDPGTVEGVQDALALAGLLLDLCQDATSLTSSSISDHAPNSDGGSGISAERLRAELGFNAPTCDISHLTGLLAPSSLAQMTWSDGVATNAFSGAESWRSLLQEHAERIARKVATQQSRTLSAQRDTTGIAIPLSTDKVLVVACKDRMGVASVAPRQDGLKAISAWQITGARTG